MQEWMLSFINNFGYFGIFLLIFIENVFPPIPSEAVLLFSGALTITTALNIPGAIAAATAGSIAGAIVLYALGRIFKAERLKIILSGKVGKVLHLRPDHVDKAQRWFSKYQGKAVLICRCIPIVRSLISIPAGFAKMNIPKFLILTLLGSAVWNSVLVAVGAGLGTAWKSALPYLDKYTYIVAIVIIVLFMAGIIYYFIRKRKKANSSNS